ncbi:hypothetical protein BDV59DRAFT_184132 [Aspergillus ambiguus]|uniref:TMEM53 family protein n=1 Tax=Aspergillus ambiguus TaxID=176160 RepID=UPI003CCD8F8E
MGSSTESPLAPFAKLGHSVYIQEPQISAADDQNAGRYPKTILLAFWMNAPPRALAKYVVEYRRLAPSARIIFIRSSSNDFLIRFTKRAQQARVTPAVEALRASQSPDEPVFVHMFSNGGVFSTISLLEAYRRATGQPLRVSSMVFDSAPGIATLSAAIKAMAFVLPRTRILHFLSKMALWIVFSLGELLRRMVRMPHAVHVARRAINDRRLIRVMGEGEKNTPRRCYVYSDSDELVHWKDVERHADDAESKGWLVHREKFLGSPHVAHMKTDPDRYWSLVARYLTLPGAE